MPELLSRLPTLLLLAGVVPGALAAQQPADTSNTPGQIAGLTVLPKWGQSKEQQRQSEEECYARAKQKVGSDPAAIAKAEGEVASADSFTPGVVSTRRQARGKAMREDALAEFRDAMRACLEGGGYTVQ